MPRIARWKDLPTGVRDHLTERMSQRAISLADLNQLRIWIESEPEVPEGDWYKTSARSRFAAAAHTRRHSCSQVKLLKEWLFDGWGCDD